MTADRISAHADDVLEVLQGLAKLLGDKGQPAEFVLELVRAGIAAIIGENTAHDPDVLRQLAADLRTEIAKRRGARDAELAAKFDTGGEA